MRKNNNIKYEIKFHTYWHCGSGLAAGADVDALVVKNEKGLPYVPGKTLKGLIREAVEELVQYKENENTENLKKKIDSVFGSFDGKDDCQRGSAFFKNAELSEIESKTIVKDNLSKYLYNSIANTAIDTATGVARRHSLRRIEVVVPCVLESEIIGVDEDIREIIIESFGLIKRLGQCRNRGLGRCTISPKERSDE